MTEPILTDLERDEEYRAVPYKDSRDLWTFATGRCLETNPLTGAEWKQLLDASEIEVNISKAGADRLLGSAVLGIRLWCAKTFQWWPTLDPVRQDVIAEMTYNLGSARFMGFREFLAAVVARDWEKAVVEMLDSLWAKQVGNRANRLAVMMKTGARP